MARIVVVGGSRDPDRLNALVEAGHEIHSIDGTRPPVAWLASHTDVDLDDEAGVVATIDRIGAIIEAVHLVGAVADQVRTGLLEAAGRRAVDDLVVVPHEAP